MTESLFNITSELKEIEHQLMDNAGEISEQQEMLMETLTMQLTTKTDNVVEWIKSQEMLIENITERSQQLDLMQSKIESKLIRFKNYVLACMDKMETTKLEGDFHKISIKKPSVVVEIEDQNAIDIEFLKTKTSTSIDKLAIKEKLKAGHEVAGAKLTTGQRKPTFK